MFLCLVVYVVAAIVGLFEENNEMSRPHFIVFLAFMVLCGWMLWEGYWFVIQMGP